MIISLGDFAGEAQQFAIKGNGPDPKEINPESGMLKYELIKYDYKTASGERWDRWHFAKIGEAYGLESEIQGVVLVQMLEKRKIKLEVFPYQKGSEIIGFTNNAKIYVR